MNIVKICAPLSFLITFQSFAGPPEDAFSQLFIESDYSVYPEAKIYANGRMQAEIAVYYKLEDGYEFIDATLKRLYTAEDLPGVSQSYNSYVKDIRLSSNKLNRDLLIERPGVTRVLFYLSAENPGVERVCVEARARNITTGNVVEKDTCSNDSNKASISVEEIERIKYSSDDFELTYESEGPSNNEYEANWLRLSIFDPVNFELYDIWDERDHNDDYAVGYDSDAKEYVEAYKVLGNCEKCGPGYGFYRVWLTPDRGALFYYYPYVAYPTYYISFQDLASTVVVSDWSPRKYSPKEHIMFLEAWNPKVVAGYATTYLAPYAFDKYEIDPERHYLYVSDQYGHFMKISTAPLDEGVIDNEMLRVINI